MLDSRPLPLPFTIISIFFMPKSAAFNAASLAALCAAKAVDFRAPFNPEQPDDDQQSVLPKRSEIVIIQLLNVVLI